MLLAISDASVLVDMAEARLLGSLTRLPYDIVVPDFVIEEITRQDEKQAPDDDSRMRKVSEGKGLMCHGTIWIVRQLVQQKIVSVARALRALHLLVDINPRLPRAECHRLLQELERTSDASD